MAIGPGKYDEVCTAVRAGTGGSVVVLVIDGEHGSGFSAQVETGRMVMIAAALREIASHIDADARFRNGENN